jgi:hypothetical protein
MPNEDAGRRFVKFTRAAGERIGRAVRAVERASRPTTGLSYGHSVPAGKVFRMGTFGTSSWPVDTTATVTLLDGTTTVSAMNTFGSLDTAASSRSVSIARDGTAWYLLQARCSQ